MSCLHFPFVNCNKRWKEEEKDELYAYGGVASEKKQSAQFTKNKASNKSGKTEHPKYCYLAEKNDPLCNACCKYMFVECFAGPTENKSNSKNYELTPLTTFIIPFPRPRTFLGSFIAQRVAPAVQATTVSSNGCAKYLSIETFLQESSWNI